MYIHNYMQYTYSYHILPCRCQHVSKKYSFLGSIFFPGISPSSRDPKLIGGTTAAGTSDLWWKPTSQLQPQIFEGGAQCHCHILESSNWSQHLRWSFVISYLKSKSKNRITGVFFLLFVVYVKKIFYHSSTLVFKSLDLPKIHPLSPWHWLWLQLRCLCLDVNWLQWAPEKFGEIFNEKILHWTKNNHVDMYIYTYIYIMLSLQPCSWSALHHENLAWDFSIRTSRN